MHTKRSRIVGVLVGAAFLLGSGCSAREQDVPMDQRPAIDGATLRNEVSYDYEIEPSATAVAQNSEAIVSGTVTSWSDGRAFNESSDSRMRYAVLEIAVGRAAGDLPTVTSPDAPTPRAGDEKPQTIFVEVYRGTNAVDRNGHDVVLPEGQATQLSVADLEAAAPVGAQVLFMGDAAPSDSEASRVRGSIAQVWQPPFEGATLLSPLLQGLLFEDVDGNYVSALVEQEDVQGHGWPDQPGASSSGDEYEQLVEGVL